MRIFDLNQLKSGSVFETDLCIIGTGPAGLSIANEFSGTWTRVIVLESGGIRDESDTQSLYNIESTGVPRVLNQELIRTRILGGSSHVWTGRCAPFDELDFDSRSWIPYSGWPLKRADLEPYFQRAASYLGLAPARYDETLWEQFQVDPPRPPLDTSALRPMFWQFSRPRRGSGSAHFGKDWVDGDAPNVEILLHANVTQINVGADGTRFESVDVSSLGGKRAQVRSRAAVLCCGGIENARLLLASNRVHSPGVGNQNHLVGRFLMDHISSPLGYFEPSQAFGVRARFGHYWFDDAQGRHVYLHGLGLSRDIQEKEGLVNCHAYIEERGLGDGDPWDALKRIKSSVRSGTIPRRDASLVLSHLDEIARGLYRRRFHHRAQLGRVKAVELHLMLEQAPDPDSRVTLSESRKDALGMPLSNIHWRIGELERISVKRMLELLADQFKRLGLPVPHGVPPLTEWSDWISRCTEKAHPTGTTRMASDAKQGVVDTNCEVHGVRGLFVSGSSIFPTSGAANPTFMIVATAVRLADYLKTQCAQPNRTVTVASAPTLREKYENVRPLMGAPGAIRVGFVGSGRRIAEVYLPILKQLFERYEVVGFTTHSPEGFRRFESSTGILSYRSAAELVEQAKPELLIVAVPDRLNEETVANLLDFKVPILAETPLAWSVSGARRIIKKAAEKVVLLGVAEQFPFLPLERFRRQLLESGVLGDLYAVLNDFQTYSYHGIAQLRRYLKGRPLRAQCREFRMGRSMIDGVPSQWQSGSVVLDDGTMLFHNFAAPDCGIPRSICLYGTLGTMQNDEIRLTHGKAGQSEIFHARRLENPSGSLASISANFSAAGKVEWNNPYAAMPFSDEEIAIASILDGMFHAIREGSQPVYSGDDFLGDIEIVQAFRFSAQRAGVTIDLPLQEKHQKALLLSSPHYWTQKLLKR